MKTSHQHLQLILLPQLYLIALLLSLNVPSVQAQNTPLPAISWAQNYGGSNTEAAYYIQATPDSGYIAIGGSASNDNDLDNNYGNSDFWLLKMTANGVIQWAKNYGGSNNEAAISVQLTPDGGYIVVGYSDSNNGDVSSNNGGADYWLLKLDALGNIQWQKNYGGSQADWGNFVALTPDGGYILTGTSNSNDLDVGGNNGLYDAWLLKLDALGNIQWEQNYGGSQYDWINMVQATPDGGYIGVGTAYSNDGDIVGNNGASDYWILKLDALGNIQWQKNYGGTSEEDAYAVQVTPDNGYIVAGYSGSGDGDASGNNGSADYWILKLDALGNMQWQKNYGGSDYDHAYNVQIVPNGGYMVSGTSYSNNGDVGGNYGASDYWLVKLNALGNMEWEQNYGGANADYRAYVQPANDGSYAILGTSDSNSGEVGNNYGNSDFWLLKTNSSPLGGNYTIGNSPNATFHTLQQAIDSLTLVGMYDTVTLQIQAGLVLNEQVHILPITGCTAATPLIIQGNGAMLTASPTTSNRAILQIDGADHLIIDSLHIVPAVGAECAWGIHLKNQADSVYIQNCLIDMGANATDTCFIGIVASASNTAIAAPQHFGNNANRTIIYNNTIKGGFMGIAICGNEDKSMRGAIVQKNRIEDSYQAASFVSYQSNARLKDNNIYLKTGARNPANENPNNTGIQLRQTISQLEVFEYSISTISQLEVFDKISIDNNDIKDPTGKGIEVEGTTKISGGTPYMVNNKVSSNFNNANTPPNAGIHLANDADNWLIYHNSVNVRNNGHALYIAANSDSIDVRNNALTYTSNTNNGYSLLIENANSLISCDYNNYYCQNPNTIAQIAGILYNSIAALPDNDHSINVNPIFLAFTDLHVLDISGQTNTADPLIASLFPTDTDGELRPDDITQLPDMGADEYIPIITYADTLCVLVGNTLQLSIPDSLNTPQWIKIGQYAELVANNHALIVSSTPQATTYVGIGNGVNVIHAYIYTLFPQYNINQNIERCEGETFSVGNNTYSASGIYTDHLYGLHNCDSIITTNLIVYPPDAASSMRVKAKVWLTACYNANTNQMDNNLRNANLLPIAQPYHIAPFNYAGNEQVNSPTQIPANAVDWILAELHNATNNTLIERRAAWLLQDGNIAEMDGTTGIIFNNLIAGNPYRLLIRHRNHLAIWAANSMILPNCMPYNFTLPNNVQGNNQTIALNPNQVGLIPADCNADGIINYADYNKMVQQNNATNLYSVSDINLDGNVNQNDFGFYQIMAKNIGEIIIRY